LVVVLGHVGEELDWRTVVDPNFLFDLPENGERPVPRKQCKFPETFGHAEFGTLKAGDSITHDVNLRRLFELKKPGKYTLQVSRLILKAMGGRSVKSNLLAITVSGD
jgi:hypothetical protein